MNMIERNGGTVAVLEDEEKINTVQDALDLMATARYHGQCIGMIAHMECLNEDFFDLKTRCAGDILQKFSNYYFKFAVVGDFSRLKSKSLRAFINESNKGSLIFFKNSVEEALEALTF